MIKAVTLDLGHTLVWTNRRMDQAYERRRCDAVFKVVLKSLPEIDREEFAKAYGRVYEDLREAWKKGRDLTSEMRAHILLKKLGVKAAQERFVLELSDAFAGLHSLRSPKLNPEAPPLLEYLKKSRLKLGVISNSTHSGKALRMMLDELGVGMYFGSIMSSCDVGVLKPDPNIFLTALRSLDVAGQECVHVGDSYSADVKGAASAGMFGILYTGLWKHYQRKMVRSGFTPKVPKDARLVARSLLEVPTIIREIEDQN